MCSEPFCNCLCGGHIIPAAWAGLRAVPAAPLILFIDYTFCLSIMPLLPSQLGNLKELVLERVRRNEFEVLAHITIIMRALR